jgi:hypothetical protein
MMRSLCTLATAATLACGQSNRVARLPVANAGFDQVIRAGSTVRFDGSASSDPDGESLIYQWQLIARPSGSGAVLVLADAVDPSLLVDVPGNYLVSLVVSNGLRESEPDRVSVRATGEIANVAPVADARCVPLTCNQDECAPYDPGCWVGHGSEANLSSSQSSDLNGDPLTYVWEQVLPADCTSECPQFNTAECPTVSEVVTPEESATDPKTWAYTAPAEIGRLTFKLTASDGNLSDTDCVTIGSINFAPRAIVTEAPKSWSLSSDGPAFKVNGAASTDSDPPDDSLHFTWSYLPLDGISVAFDPNELDPSPLVSVTGISAPTEVTLVLTVDDGNSVNSSSLCEPEGLAACIVECCGAVVTVSP